MADIKKIKLLNNQTYDLMPARVDSTPTADSDNMVSSLGIKNYVDDNIRTDVFGYGRNTEIPSPSNLNDYTTPGVYYRSSNTSNILNMPIEGYSFKLVVEYIATSSRLIQKFYPTWSLNSCYIREKYRDATSSDPTIWSDWSLEGTTASFWQGTTITSAIITDFNQITKIGRYSFGSSTAKLLANGPFTYILQSTEPDDWATTYKTTYFTRTEQYGIEYFNHVTGETAPTFQANTYYKTSGAAGGTLTVENIQGNMRIRQVFVPNDTLALSGVYYVRFFASSYSGTWSGWYAVGPPGLKGQYVGGIDAAPRNVKNLDYGVWYRDSGATTALTGLPSDYTASSIIINVQTTTSTKRRITIFSPSDATTYWVCSELSGGWTEWSRYGGTGNNGKTLTASDNLDNIYLDGSYVVPTTDIARSIGGTKPPLDMRYKLLVYGITGSASSDARCIQVAMPSTSSVYFYMRSRNSPTGSTPWTSWQRLDLTGAARVAIENNQDLLELLPGRYYRTSLTNFSTIGHLPSDLPAGIFFLDVENTYTRVKRTLRLYPIDPNCNYYYIRNENDNGWGSWYKYSGTAVADA